MCKPINLKALRVIVIRKIFAQGGVLELIDCAFVNAGRGPSTLRINKPHPYKTRPLGLDDSVGCS
jgi:hypothetical protein